MDRYRTLRASLLATALTVSLTSGVYAQGWEQWRAPAESTSGWPVTSGVTLVPSGDILVKVPLSSAVPLILRGQDEHPVLGTKPIPPPDQIGTPSDIPNIQLPPIPFDSTSVLSAPDLAGLGGSGSTLGAKGDVFHGRVLGRDDGILLKNWNDWNRDYDPGIVWPGIADSLKVIRSPLDSLWRANGSIHMNEGDVMLGGQSGSFSIGNNRITFDSGVSSGPVLGGDAFGSSSSNSITIGPSSVSGVLDVNGQKHDHYYLKDGKRYYMQYTWPDKTALKMEERVGTSDIWLIGESTATPKK